jgi:hypothetical protein
MNLCNYSNIFGEPNTGIHSIRLFNIAIVDVLVVLLFDAFICYITRIPYWICVFVTFILGIVAHRAFCVKTTIDKILFGENDDL